VVEWRKRVLAAYCELRASVGLALLRQRNHALPGCQKAATPAFVALRDIA